MNQMLIFFFSRLAQIGLLGLQLIWHFLHFIVSAFYFVVGIATTLESYLISWGFPCKYKHLNIDRVQYLAIVVESDEAYNTLKMIELLEWLVSLGIRSVCLYDAEGNDFVSIQKFWALFYFLPNACDCFFKFVEWYAYSTVFYFQGVLKQSKEIILKKVKNASEFQVHATIRKIQTYGFSKWQSFLHWTKWSLILWGPLFEIWM